MRKCALFENSEMHFFYIYRQRPYFLISIRRMISPTRLKILTMTVRRTSFHGHHLLSFLYIMSLTGSPFPLSGQGVFLNEMTPHIMILFLGIFVKKDATAHFFCQYPSGGQFRQFLNDIVRLFRCHDQFHRHIRTVIGVFQAQPL